MAECGGPGGPRGFLSSCWWPSAAVPCSHYLMWAVGRLCEWEFLGNWHTCVVVPHWGGIAETAVHSQAAQTALPGFSGLLLSKVLHKAFGSLVPRPLVSLLSVPQISSCSPAQSFVAVLLRDLLEFNKTKQPAVIRWRGQPGKGTDPSACLHVVSPFLVLSFPLLSHASHPLMKMY